MVPAPRAMMGLVRTLQNVQSKTPENGAVDLTGKLGQAFLRRRLLSWALRDEYEFAGLTPGRGISGRERGITWDIQGTAGPSSGRGRG